MISGKYMIVISILWFAIGFLTCANIWMRTL